MLKLHALTSHTCKRDLVIIKHRIHSLGYGSLITSSTPSRSITVLPTCSFREKIAHCGLDKHSYMSKETTSDAISATTQPSKLSTGNISATTQPSKLSTGNSSADVLHVSCLIWLAQTAAALSTKVMRMQHRY